MAVFHNVGIAIAVAFGATECIELYENFYTAFRELFQIDLARYYLASDQGPALMSIGKRDPCPLLCLRHFLVSLKQKQFSLHVGQLVKDQSLDEARCLKEASEARFRAVTSPVERQLRVKTLGKAGLGLTDDQITIGDPHRWEAVSLMHRATTRMPSTTNSIESTDGDLNDTTTRNNPFWGSLFLLAEMMFRRVRGFRELLQRGFSRAVKKGVKRAAFIPADEMQRERERLLALVRRAAPVVILCCSRQYIAAISLAVIK
jgi:hypothetical protein